MAALKTLRDFVSFGDKALTVTLSYTQFKFRLTVLNFFENLRLDCSLFVLN